MAAVHRHTADTSCLKPERQSELGVLQSTLKVSHLTVDHTEATYRVSLLWFQVCKQHQMEQHSANAVVKDVWHVLNYQKIITDKLFPVMFSVTAYLEVKCLLTTTLLWEGTGLLFLCVQSHLWRPHLETAETFCLWSFCITEFVIFVIWAC